MERGSPAGNPDKLIYSSSEVTKEARLSAKTEIENPGPKCFRVISV